MDIAQHNALETIVQLVIHHGPEEMAAIHGGLLEVAMAVEQEEFIGAERHQRTTQRRAYRNGTKPKRVDLPVGTVTVQVPKTAGHAPGESFYPQALTRGRRATETLSQIAAEMYVQGVSTRRVERVMQACGVKSFSAAQVSRAMQKLDTQLREWRHRPLGQCPEVIVDARYERAHIDGRVQGLAVFVAIGFTPDGQRQLLGYAVAPSEAESHWQDFLEGLVARGLCGVQFVTSDCHAGARNAIRTVFPTAAWQRCQVHITRNARHRAPNQRVRVRIGRELRAVWNSPDRADAEATLRILVARYRTAAPAFADWLAANVPDGLRVFARPAAHRLRLRTTNMLERAVQQEVKRRTQSVRAFADVAAVERLVGAILVDIDEKWMAEAQPYLVRMDQNE